MEIFTKVELEKDSDCSESFFDCFMNIETVCCLPESSPPLLHMWRRGKGMRITEYAQNLSEVLFGREDRTGS
jgi:hypothetical protein